MISDSADGAYSVYATDVDGDGDVDVLSASTRDDKIAWYENDGQANFTEHVISDSVDGARSVYATDVDGDGDVDVLSASSKDHKIAWYENVGIVGIAENEQTGAPDAFNLLPNYPNPFNPGTTIRYHLPRASRVKLQVYNPLGQVVRTLVEGQQPAGRYTVQWDGRDASGRQLPAGVYFYRLKAGQFEQVRKMVLVR
ncbi:MAG: T9SS type A sorting domain-containing protein [Calditrichaeota bacterium]|nr:T9SS type A sorting domain-containing protein [Calditrichota bacterium]